MAAKRKITLNRKKKEPEAVEQLTNEEIVEETVEMASEKPEEVPMVEESTLGSTVIENEISDVDDAGWTRTSLKWEIVWNWTRTVFKQPKGRIKFEAQLATVPMFKLPEEIRRYLISNGLPTTVWKWDKEKLESRNVDMTMVEKLKKFLSGMNI